MNAQQSLDLLDQMGPLLKASELARVLGWSRGQFYKLAAQGTWKRFEADPAIPPRIYLKSTVARYLTGERIDDRTFGRKRSA